MDTSCLKTERTYCNILKETFSYQKKKGTFSRRLQPTACVNTRSYGVQPYDHTREAAKDSSAQKWSLNNAHHNNIHKHYPWINYKSVTWLIVYYGVR